MFAAPALTNRPIDNIVWPETLRELNFIGPLFNYPIDRTPLPRDLEVLKLGGGFNQPLEDIAWPQGLQRVDLGHSFERSMERAVWPKSLRKVTAPFGVPLGRLPEGCIVRLLNDPEGDDAARMAMAANGVAPSLQILYDSDDDPDMDDFGMFVGGSDDEMFEDYLREAYRD